MTLQSTPPLSLRQIAAEFGQTTGPFRLKDFYAGGTHVPAGTKNGAGTPIPSGGQISVLNFLGASSEASGPAILSAFWTYRAQTIRGTIPNDGSSSGINYSTTYPGDLVPSNTPQPDGNKYQGHPSFNWSFNASSMAGMSSRSTIVLFANGGHPGAGTWYVTYTDAVGNTYYPDESAFQVVIQGSTNQESENMVLLLHTNVKCENLRTIHFEYDATSASDSGSWAGCFILPAWWDGFAVNPFVTNFEYNSAVTAQNSDYWDAMDPGEWGFLVSGNAGGDSSAYINEPVSAGSQGGSLQYINWTTWWYNVMGFQAVINTTTNQYTFDWTVMSGPGSTSCHAFNNYDNTNSGGGGPMVLAKFRKSGVAALSVPPSPAPGSYAPPPSGGGGGGGGGGGCVAVESFLERGRAYSVQMDDKMTVAHPGTLVETEDYVVFSKERTMPGYRIVTAQGASLRCSDTAPIPVMGGVLLNPEYLLGHRVAVKRGDEVRFEEVTEVIFLGPIQVQHISINDGCFWAGESADAFILHHNKAPVEEL